MGSSGYGLSTRSAPGWHNEVYRREPPPGQVTHPVLHACTRALPAARGDFGSGAVEQLGSEDVFVALVEFGIDVADEGLFARQGMPRLAPSQFSPNRMPRSLPGLSAAQHFFSKDGRAFCLYVVIGSHSRRMALAGTAQRLVDAISITGTSALMRQGGMP